MRSPNTQMFKENVVSLFPITDLILLTSFSSQCITGKNRFILNFFSFCECKWSCSELSLEAVNAQTFRFVALHSGGTWVAYVALQNWVKGLGASKPHAGPWVDLSSGGSWGWLSSEVWVGVHTEVNG